MKNKIVGMLSAILAMTLLVTILVVPAYATDCTALDGNVKFSYTTGSISVSDTTVTATAVGATNTFYLYNNTDKDAQITFNWKLTRNKSAYDATCTIEGTTYSVSYSNWADVNPSGSFDKNIPAGGYVELSVYAKKGNLGSGTSTLTLTDLTYKEVESTYTVTVNHGTGGTVTIDGTTVTSGTAYDVSPTTGATMAATAQSGYTFLGWIEGDNKLLSTSASYTITPTVDTSVQAIFVKSTADTAWFDVDGAYLTNDLNAAGTLGTKITLANDGTLAAGSYTIASGDTLLIPFDTAYTLYTNEPAASADKGNVTTFRQLTMASGANITVNGSISISGKHTRSVQGNNPCNNSPTGPQGMIKMESGSTITVNNGGNLYAWGYIYGSGSVTANSGATVYELIQIADHPGNAQATATENGVFPFSQYYVQNIEVPKTYHAGASGKVFATFYMPTFSYSMSQEIDYVGESGGMFILESGTLKIDYDEATDRVIYTQNGDAKLNSISVNVISDSLSTADFVFPFHGGQTYHADSGTFTILYDVALFPGAKVIIDEEAKAIVNGSVFVYDKDDWGNYVCINETNCTTFRAVSTIGGTYTRTDADLTDMEVIVNGTADFSNGFLYTTTGGANICSEGSGRIIVNEGTTETTYQATGYTYVSTVQTDVTYDEIAITPAKLKNADGSYLQSATGTYTYSADHGKWVLGEHTIDDGVVTAPTCTAKGYTTHTCTCGYSYTADEVAATGHTEVTDAAVAATCTTAGKTAGSHCSVCKAVIVAQTEIPANGHTEATKEDNRKEATCTTAGSYDLVTYCSVCTVEISRESKTIPASHTIAQGVAQTKTCTQDGWAAYEYCTECDYTTKVVTPAGHTIVQGEAQTKTCTQDGWAAYEYCTECDYTTKVVIPASHTYGTPVWTWTGNDTDGYTAATATFTCSVCGASETATDDVLTSEITDATTTTNGNITYTAEVTFEDKGYTDTKEVTIPATGDSEEDTVVGTIIDNQRTLSLAGVIYINQYAAFEGFDGLDEAYISEHSGLLTWSEVVSEEDAMFGYGNPDVNEGMEPQYKNGVVIEYRVQTDGIPMKSYADELYLRVYLELPDGSYAYGPLVPYSVQTYCEGRLEKSSNEKLKDTCATLLHFGAAAQKYFEYNTGDLANANIAENWPEYASNIDEYAYDAGYVDALPETIDTDIVQSENVKNNGRTLSLAGAIFINYYYEIDFTPVKAELLFWEDVDGTVSADNVTSTSELTLDGDEYKGQSREFAAKEYGKVIYACARFEDEAGNIYYSDVAAYSPEAYAEGRISKSTNANLVETCKWMIVYGEYARVYFG